MIAEKIRERERERDLCYSGFGLFLAAQGPPQLFTFKLSIILSIISCGFQIGQANLKESRQFFLVQSQFVWPQKPALFSMDGFFCETSPAGHSLSLPYSPTDIDAKNQQDFSDGFSPWRSEDGNARASLVPGGAHCGSGAKRRGGVGLAARFLTSGVASAPHFIGNV